MTQLRIALVARDVARQARVAARWKGATLTAVATDPLYPLRTDGLPPTLWTGDAGDLFRSGTVEFDAVLAADLAHWTVEVLAKQAAEAGKHLLLESGVVHAADDFRAMRAQLESKGLRLIAGNPLRARRSVRTVSDVLRSGKLGAPGVVRIHRWRRFDDPAFPAATPLRELVDLVCWLFDDEPTRLFARPVGAGAQSPPLSSVLMHLVFPDGGAALIDFVGDLPTGDDYWSLSVIGSSGAAYDDDHHNRQLVFSDGPARGVSAAEGDPALLGLQQGLINALVNGAEDVAPWEFERASRIVDAVERSLATGEPQERSAGGAYEAR